MDSAYQKFKLDEELVLVCINSGSGKANKKGGDNNSAGRHVATDDLWLLELFHGPTLAFKDLALALVGSLLEYYLSKQQRHVSILVGKVFLASMMLYLHCVYTLLRYV